MVLWAPWQINNSLRNNLMGFSFSLTCRLADPGSVVFCLFKPTSEVHVFCLCKQTMKVWSLITWLKLVTGRCYLCFNTLNLNVLFHTLQTAHYWLVGQSFQCPSVPVAALSLSRNRGAKNVRCNTVYLHCALYNVQSKYFHKQYEK